MAVPLPRANPQAPAEYIVRIALDSAHRRKLGDLAIKEKVSADVMASRMVVRELDRIGEGGA